MLPKKNFPIGSDHDQAQTKMLPTQAGVDAGNEASINNDTIITTNVVSVPKAIDSNNRFIIFNVRAAQRPNLYVD